MKNGLKKFIIVCFLIIAGTILWARFIGTRGLIVREYALTNNLIPQSFVGSKIVHFSDLHYGRTVDDEKLKLIADKINQLKPQIVVFTGDLVDKDVPLTEEKINVLKEFLNSIDAEVGKYTVRGNHDYKNDVYETILAEGGFKMLDNTSEEIYYQGNTPIILTGLTSSIKSHPDYENRYTNLELTEEELNSLYKITIVHEPDQLLKIKDDEINLMLAGHSHNGQVRLPFLGAVKKTEGSITYYESYYKVDETDLYISGGIGCSWLNLRLLNKPSISLYRLYQE